MKLLELCKMPYLMFLWVPLHLKRAAMTPAVLPLYDSTLFSGENGMPVQV